MPIYEYECTVCGHVFEKLKKISDTTEEVCPSCSGPVQKLISSPGLVFKGSGFYITDYSRKNGAALGGDSGASANKSDPGKTATPEKKESSKTEKTGTA